MDDLFFECGSHDLGFSYIHKTQEYNKKESNPPHTHKDLFEIFMLINGDVDYVIEGNRFHVNPYDIVLVNNDELHRSVVNNNSTYEFVLLSINLDFFVKNNCNDFTDMIFNRKSGSNNIIPAETVISSGLYDIYTNLEKYTHEDPVCLTVVKSIIIEFLYNLNKQVIKTSDSNYNQKNIKNIIQYINEHLTENLSLDVIANHFFLTKPYLCKTFKANTGFTIKNYVSYKRIVLVRELYSSGMTISGACIQAGFNDYSSFYRTFTKIMHEPPKKNLSNIKFRFENSETQNSSKFK